MLSTTGNSAFSQSIFQRLFIPRFVSVTAQLRAYIENEMHPPVFQIQTELADIDSIYIRALQLSEGDIATALFSSSMAVLNRTDIKPTFPLIGVIKLPLPSEDSADAAKRISHLPEYFFQDSPHDKWGDSDKLAHFFGSAYLAYTTGTKFIPDILGNAVETGEVALKLDTAADPRDVFANRLGQNFGKMLRKNEEVLPSDFLRTRFVRK
ncbi:MAG: hypothetical protein ACP5MI_10410 [Candidatus Kryptoniota bacterium]